MKLAKYAEDPVTFCPIDWYNLRDVFLDTNVPDSSLGIHLWNEIWRRNGIDKNGTYHEESLYERLKECYGMK